MRVLVADDDAAVRTTLVESLTSRGVEVLEACDGMETMRQVTRCRLHAVELDGLVVDLRLPRLGGINALRKIRDMLSPKVAIIVLTDAIEPSLHRQAEALGARVVLAKPLNVTQFWEVLLNGGSDGAPAAAEPVAASSPSPTVGRRVLVVDDDADLREVVVEFLDARGYHVATAPDGLTAVRLLGEQPFDVILLDINMPGLCGVDALPTIRALTPRTPVIMVTANIDRDIARRTLAHGAFDYLVKPVNWSHLAQSVKLALESQALAAETSPA
jgi:CheY-like chemotaxis protein